MKSCCCASDSYVTYWPDKGLYWCWKCKAPAGAAPQKKAPTKKPMIDKMPKEVERLTARKWNKCRPWPKFPFELVEKFGFYLSNLSGRVVTKGEWVDYAGVYLVMPVTRLIDSTGKGKKAKETAVSFSARLIDGPEHAPKYVIPSDVQKHYWISSPTLGKKGSVVFICEGIADAAFFTLLGEAIGLLGLNYDGILNNLLESKTVVIAMDGDFMGAATSTRLASYCSLVADKSVILPFGAGKDPTDFTHGQLKKMIKEIGVKI